MKTNKYGFGLIEILVVIVIIALLALILIPRLTGSKDPLTGKKTKSPVQRAKQEVGNEYIGQINQAITMYRSDHDNENPPNLQALKPYGVIDEMIIDPNTKQPVSYDPRTGTVGGTPGSNGSAVQMLDGVPH